MVIDTTNEWKAFLELASTLFTQPGTGVLIALLAIAAVTDFRTFRIPNWLTGGGLAFALALSLTAPAGTANLGEALSGMLVGFLIMVPMYALRAMGAGDGEAEQDGVEDALGAKEGAYHCHQLDVAGVAAFAFAATHGVLGRLFCNVRNIVTGIAWSALGGVRPVARLDPADSVGRLAYGISIAIGTGAYVVAQHFFLI